MIETGDIVRHRQQDMRRGKTYGYRDIIATKKTTTTRTTVLQ